MDASLQLGLGLTPLNRSSGGKERLGRISKKGDRYIRRLLVMGMTSQVQRARGYPERVHPWIMQLLERKPIRLATIAMAKQGSTGSFGRSSPKKPTTGN